MVTCFIDETGDTGLESHSSKYFAFAGVATNCPVWIRTIMNDYCIRYHVSEIKFRMLKHNDIIEILDKIMKIDCFIICDIYEKSHMNLFFKKSERFYSDTLKIFLHFIEQHFPNDRDFVFVVDERTKRRPSKFFFELYQDLTDITKYNDIIYQDKADGLIIQIPLKHARVTSLKIEYKNSVLDRGIQVADIIAGCTSHWLSCGNHEYLKKIAQRFIYRRLPEKYNDKVSTPLPYESEIKKISSRTKKVIINFPRQK